MILRKIIVLVCLFLVVAVTSISGQWHKVGTKEIDNTVDHDTLHVTDWRDGFRRMRLGVEHAPVDFFRVVITYGSGITEEIIVQALIHPGHHTYVKELHLHERSVRKIEFWYEPESLEGHKALVTLYARE